MNKLKQKIQLDGELWVDSLYQIVPHTVDENFCVACLTTFKVADRNAHEKTTKHMANSLKVTERVPTHPMKQNIMKAWVRICQDRERLSQGPVVRTSDDPGRANWECRYDAFSRGKWNIDLWTRPQHALMGLEMILIVYDGDSWHLGFCALCDETHGNKESLIRHVESRDHRKNYLHEFLPDCKSAIENDRNLDASLGMRRVACAAQMRQGRFQSWEISRHFFELPGSKELITESIRKRKHYVDNASLAKEASRHTCPFKCEPSEEPSQLSTPFLATIPEPSLGSRHDDLDAGAPVGPRPPPSRRARTAAAAAGGGDVPRNGRLAYAEDSRTGQTGGPAQLLAGSISSRNAGVSRDPRLRAGLIPGAPVTVGQPADPRLVKMLPPADVGPLPSPAELSAHLPSTGALNEEGLGPAVWNEAQASSRGLQHPLRRVVLKEAPRPQPPPAVQAPSTSGRPPPSKTPPRAPPATSCPADGSDRSSVDLLQRFGSDINEVHALGESCAAGSAGNREKYSFKVTGPVAQTKPRNLSRLVDQKVLGKPKEEDQRQRTKRELPEESRRPPSAAPPAKLSRRVESAKESRRALLETQARTVYKGFVQDPAAEKLPPAEEFDNDLDKCLACMQELRVVKPIYGEVTDRANVENTPSYMQDFFEFRAERERFYKDAGYKGQQIENLLADVLNDFARTQKDKHKERRKNKWDSEVVPMICRRYGFETLQDLEEAFEAAKIVRESAAAEERRDGDALGGAGGGEGGEADGGNGAEEQGMDGVDEGGVASPELPGSSAEEETAVKNMEVDEDGHDSDGGEDSGRPGPARASSERSGTAVKNMEVDEDGHDSDGRVEDSGRPGPARASFEWSGTASAGMDPSAKPENHSDAVRPPVVSDSGTPPVSVEASSSRNGAGAVEATKPEAAKEKTAVKTEKPDEVVGVVAGVEDERKPAVVVAVNPVPEQPQQATSGRREQPVSVDEQGAADQNQNHSDGQTGGDATEKDTSRMLPASTFGPDLKKRMSRALRLMLDVCASSVFPFERDDFAHLQRCLAAVEEASNPVQVGSAAKLIWSRKRALTDFKAACTGCLEVSLVEIARHHPDLQESMEESIKASAFLNNEISRLMHHIQVHGAEPKTEEEFEETEADANPGRERIAAPADARGAEAMNLVNRALEYATELLRRNDLGGGLTEDLGKYREKLAGTRSVAEARMLLRNIYRVQVLKRTLDWLEKLFVGVFVREDERVRMKSCIKLGKALIEDLATFVHEDALEHDVKTEDDNGC